jgi:hypothetical protein
MYSIITLTMWKCERFRKTLSELNEHPLIGEIILIDNSEIEVEPLNLNKLNHIKEEKNTYINPAWNKGVSLAKYDKLLILNDDVWMDWGILDILSEYITPSIGAIGFAGNAIDLEETTDMMLTPVTHRYGNFGVAMFIHKASWMPIPEEMKLWGGDDWIFVKNRNSGKPNFKLEGMKLYGEISGTLENADLTPILNPIKENDLKLKNYYNLF